jgi:hypothetical protein
MRCKNVHCALNDELLALLPMLDGVHQHMVLHKWAGLKLDERREALRLLRAGQDIEIEPDLVALAKLAVFFQCDVFDMVRYTRTRDPSSKDGPGA